MSKIILLSSIKGGVGKTTVTEALAHFMVSKGEQVTVVDADLQKSLVHDIEADRRKHPNSAQLWDCVDLNTLDIANTNKVLAKLAAKSKGYILIDCPGNMQDPSLSLLFEVADTIVVPLSFDRKTLDATSTFVLTLRKLGSTAKLVFVPNRINTTESNAEYLERRRTAKEILEKVGRVTARIKQSVVFNRLDMFVQLDKYQYNAVENAFNDILEVINKSKLL